MKRIHYLIAIIGSMAVALVTFSEIILKNDPVSRIIMGTIWIFICIIWIIVYLSKENN